jgi:glycosyltransferase involved in cell wall biosynthesis
MNRPIRILELRTVRGTGGGPEKTILQSAARTDRNRFAVTVCYLRDARDADFCIQEQAASLQVNYQEVLERHSWDPRIWVSLRRLVGERQIDIVHSHEYKSNFFALLLAKFAHTIPLATMHNWTGHSRREKFYYAVDKRLLRSFPCLIAVSDQIRRTIVEAGAREDRVRTILNGIDPHVYRRVRSKEHLMRDALSIREQEKVIGAVGRLELEKRFDILLHAFASIRMTRPHLRLLIAGEGPERANLQNIISRLNLKDSCNLLGHRTDIVDLHHEFDLFVQSSEKEGTPNAVLEAMAMETPVVATRVGGTAELIQDGIHGLLASPGDATALAESMKLALDNPTALAKRTAAARERVELELSFDNRLKAVEAIYEELMQEKLNRKLGRGSIL